MLSLVGNFTYIFLSRSLNLNPESSFVYLRFQSCRPKHVCVCVRVCVCVKSVDPDEIAHNEPSDQDLHCLFLFF